MRLHSARERLLLVAPIRLGLGIVWLVAARLVGTGSSPALLAFGTGLFAIVFLLVNDPRPRLLGRGEPKPAPADACVAGRVRQALAATMPSTVGVSVLAAASLVVAPVMAALLAGVVVGLGVAGALAALRIRPDLYVDPKTGAVYRVDPPSTLRPCRTGP